MFFRLRSHFQRFLPAPLQDFGNFFSYFQTLDQTKVDLETCVLFAASHFFKCACTVPTSGGVLGDSASSRPHAPLLVVLLVDEVGKSLSADRILSLVGNLLDEKYTTDAGQPVVLFPIATSVSEKLLLNYSLSSGRLVRFVTLPVSLIDAVAEIQDLLRLGPKFNDVLAWLCSRVGHHGRDRERPEGRL